MVAKTRKKEKIVTVCLANRARSPTAEWLLHRHYRVKSCGTAQFDATKPCDKWDMKWATKVLVMEPYQKDNLESRFPKEAAGKVEVLDVPEVGKYSCQPSLLEEIAQRLEERHFKVRNIKDLTRASGECMDWTSSLAERKIKGKRAQSYVMTDYWTPSQARDTWAETDEFGRKPLEPWQIEEEKAFQRASRASRKTTATRAETPVETWYGEDIPQDILVELREQYEKEKPVPVDYEEPKSRKVRNKLKEYAESVKEFFQS